MAIIYLNNIISLFHKELSQSTNKFGTYFLIVYIKIGIFKHICCFFYSFIYFGKNILFQLIGIVYLGGKEKGSS